MSEALAAAEARFLAPANLTEVQLATQLGIMLRGDIDFADLYFQHAEQQASPCATRVPMHKASWLKATAIMTPTASSEDRRPRKR